MLLAERLPSMTDKEIVILAANALRLTASENPNQREAAETLIPLIKAEQAARIAAKPPAAKRKAAVKKTAAVVVEADAEADA